MVALSNIQSPVPKQHNGRWNGNNGKYEKNQKLFHPPRRKNKSLVRPSELKQRWITRILSFLALVVYYLHNEANTIIFVGNHIASDDKGQRQLPSFSDSSSMHTKTNHIHLIPNNNEQGSSNINVNATTNAKENNVRISFSLHDPTEVPFKSLYAPGE